MRQTSCSRRLTTKETRADSGRPLELGAEVELDFNDLLVNGQAVGRSGSMVVFCFGPLPQERARVRITALKPKYAVGELVELLAISPFRSTPFCPVFGTCGGCQIQHMSYPAQLLWKRDVVSSALQRIGSFNEIAVSNTIGMVHPRAYRNKMSLVVEQGAPMPRLGFYQQRSHALVPIDGCPIVMPQLNAHIGKLNDALFAPPTARAFSSARHIVERTAQASEQSVVTFTTAQPSQALAESAGALLSRLPGAVGITNSFELTSENAIMGRKHKVLAGVPEIHERIAGINYRVSAGSFFQVNVEIVGRIFDFMRSHLARCANVVDLYCGAGTFSLYFAKAGHHVVGVEENAQAIAEARANAGLNALNGSVKFICARVEIAVRRADVRGALRRAQIVFLDPPRKGSDEVTLEGIAESGVPNIWYLSCDPATLARDLKFLAAKGYRVGIVQPFDMFPQTGHIETLATMYRPLP
jgi:23S rRNA (uracil1939-C5)-methyltransferase